MLPFLSGRRSAWNFSGCDAFHYFLGLHRELLLTCEEKPHYHVCAPLCPQFQLQHLNTSSSRGDRHAATWQFLQWRLRLRSSACGAYVHLDRWLCNRGRASGRCRWSLSSAVLVGFLWIIRLRRWSAAFVPRATPYSWLFRSSTILWMWWALFEFASVLSVCRLCVRFPRPFRSVFLTLRIHFGDFWMLRTAPCLFFNLVRLILIHVCTFSANIINV